MAHNEYDDELKKDKFLACLNETGLMATALSMAGLTRGSYNRLCRQDPDFEEQVQDRMEQMYDKLEAEARRRAVEGVEKGIYYKGELVGHEQQYSDSLLMFLMKGYRPETFGDKTKITGDANQPLTVVIRDVTSTAAINAAAGAATNTVSSMPSMPLAQSPTASIPAMTKKLSDEDDDVIDVSLDADMTPQFLSAMEDPAAAVKKDSIDAEVDRILKASSHFEDDTEGDNDD